MLKKLFLLAAAVLLTVNAWAGPQVIMETNKGDITIELDQEKAPESVKNFLRYVDEGFYSGTVFHRVIKDFMIQGGGFDGDLKRKETHPPIVNEAGNGLKNNRGTLAMARTGVVDSATSQFFINLKDNDFLNQRGRTPQEFGYAVFGKVVEGMDIVDMIGNARTKRVNGLFQDLPEEQVLIKAVRRVAP
ncbi:peptidyl-prolyl cis-trans isomerase A [Desulfuromonas versatilis]|uniref:Peptidyl-prolyl cis-trans isomerase n=1 Tax=Desulfuromonas versatilis TaxID=2802975 RepID=A0ABM8HQ97_9BACT|nr:peptidylprolyl isomerase [Desulfuromonas versatilis]BCR02933.1 peptidyl-prolyl cis-trans isomerase A [Desulfuromonas versatilis]